MTINQKIWMSFGILLTLVGAGSTASYIKSRQAEHASTQLVQVYLAELTSAQAARQERAALSGPARRR